MPEWPEMENYRSLLSGLLLDKEISGVTLNREKSVNLEPEMFKQELIGRKVIFVERRAKYLIFHLDNGRRLLLHLMLGGMLYFGSEEDKPKRNTQIEIQFGDQTLYFIGLRLGYLHLLTAKQTEEELSDLGPELLDRRMNEQRFIQLLSGRKGMLKTTLVNQHVMAGIGNCYADEIAFAAELRPDVKMQDLDEQDLAKLYQAVKVVLTDAAEHGGYMEMPLTAEDKLTGGFNDLCKVYDREGETCVRCGHPIVKTELASRKVFYCANCQHGK
ncbi:Fpg/Nei family DNA glycosylase [Paenibacillus physcomitrellae]|uniref:Formamidopyrimidine-DNA glycosylase n=1 Tax=Paenibacillus physcomitrellae TaxID=1619311 RepID=A0ABQ1FPD3_9BACL|nr:DNA-formamidopyrimidine glycosylase family protein [Paenibacillus physcomitrellae]GGA24950.1 formamidopyrimidine-DNA glycosylase [Paenibacillus physcomitrellae]